MLTIKVLGSGCPNCKKVAALAEMAVEKLGVQAQIIKVTDYNDIAAYNIMSTPGLVINEKVVCAGRIPSGTQISAWINEALQTA